MNNSENQFDEQMVQSLIKGLLAEKERYQQEKLAQKIGHMKDERTTELVADLLYSDDAYIRNMAIEIIITLGQKALPVLKRKLSDRDGNIRKFALDALKYINGKQSCEIALSALEDKDENVVEAALEVIAEQSYKEASEKLLDTFKKTNSVWIVNSLLRTFASVDVKCLSGVFEGKIFSMKATTIEKNILVNTYVRFLGRTGSYQDIEIIINKYSKDFMIDDSNLVFGLSSLILKNEIPKPPEEVVVKLEEIFKARWDYQDSSQILVSIAAFVKLQLDFFLHDIKVIYNFYRGQEFFIENLIELIQQLKDIPAGFVKELLTCEEPELIIMGLRLIHTKQLHGFNIIVEKLCNSKDNDISKLSICIITNIDFYKNTMLLKSLTDFSEEAEVASIESIDNMEYQAIDSLLLKLEHQSRKVRKTVAQKLIAIPAKVNIKLLEEIVIRNQGEEGVEALEVLFRFNEIIGWDYINSKVDCSNESVRVELVDIVKRTDDDVFYRFMTKMIDDPSPAVRKKVIKALNNRMNERSLCLLEKLYQVECDSVNKMEIVSNLYKFNSDNAIYIIHDAAFNSDILTRMAAVKALSFTNDSKAVDILHRMLDDKVKEVVDAANAALCKKEVAK